MTRYAVKGKRIPVKQNCSFHFKTLNWKSVYDHNNNLIIITRYAVRPKGEKASEAELVVNEHVREQEHF